MIAIFFCCLYIHSYSNLLNYNKVLMKIKKYQTALVKIAEKAGKFDGAYQAGWISYNPMYQEQGCDCCWECNWHSRIWFKPSRKYVNRQGGNKWFAGRTLAGAVDFAVWNNINRGDEKYVQVIVYDIFGNRIICDGDLEKIREWEIFNEEVEVAE